MISNSSINIASWNRNGLNGLIKHAACLDYLRRQHVDIALIQESHLKNYDTHWFANKHYYTAAASAVDSKTRGSLVVLKQSLSLTILENYGSKDGHITYIRTIISGQKFVYVYICTSNILILFL